jgi:hypothetical protein
VRLPRIERIRRLALAEPEKAYRMGRS